MNHDLLSIFVISLITSWSLHGVIYVIGKLIERFEKRKLSMRSCDNCGNHWCFNGFGGHDFIDCCVDNDFSMWNPRE